MEVSGDGGGRYFPLVSGAGELKEGNGGHVVPP